MTTDITQTLQERGNRYGKFGDQARITQNIKRAMADSRNWRNLTDSQRESLELLAGKIGRILNGDPNYHDSWHDIGGYSKLVADELLTDGVHLDETGPAIPAEKEHHDATWAASEWRKSNETERVVDHYRWSENESGEATLRLFSATGTSRSYLDLDFPGGIDPDFQMPVGKVVSGLWTTIFL